MEFKSLPSKVNLPEMEEKVMRYWEKHDILEKYLNKNSETSKRFSFIDGPITANNPMGVHHARGRAMKDLFQRFKNMQGYKQRFQNGFDCQGLWVEVEVEKSLGFDSKKDIEEYGLDEFTRACKDRVKKFAKKITEQSRRLGYFMDWDNSYYTMSENNNLHIWAFLKECHERGLIFKSHSSVAWCPRCETGLSKHEQADGYKHISEESVYVKFPLKDKKDEYFLVWTTTPWTLPANVLLAVNPELQYVKAEKEGEIFYLAEEPAKRLQFQDYEKINIESFVGQRYTPPYPDIEAQEGVDHFVAEWRMVDGSEGTGIVHIAPGCGEEDFELGKELGVPALSPITERGIFTKGYGELTGLSAHDVKEQVLDHLRQKGLLYGTEQITHSYPHCWRCGTKCLFRLEDNWFINCHKIKEDLKEKAREVDWIPDYVGRRMEDWLENMGDWMISRRRFYGLSLPFYECQECGKLVVVGGKEELKSLAVNPEKVDALPSLHRPWIDEVEIRCPECGKIVKRIPEVGDCWLDAGVVPFSTLHYLDNKAYWKKWFPADFISEMIEQVRLWYYSMLVYGVIFEKSIPYKKVLSYDEVRDEEGERMSKSKGNGIPYAEAVERMGADVMRWLYFRTNPSAPVNFGYGLARKAKKGVFFTLWNCYRFFLGFASIEIDSQEKVKKIEGRKSSRILDKWIISRLARTGKEVTKHLERFDPASASKILEEFVIKDLSLWYIRRSRHRVGPQARDRQDKLDCYATFLSVLRELSKLMAPFIPFMAEKLWYQVSEEESVHMEDWPEFDKELLDDETEETMNSVRKICSIGHSLRKESGVKTRQPLSLLQVKGRMDRPDEQFVDLIKQELNVKQIYFVSEIKKGGGGEEEGWAEREEEGLIIALRTEITPELKQEGVKREVVRRVQHLRKEAGLRPSHKIEIYYMGDRETEKAVRRFEKEIRKETISLSAEKVFSKEKGMEAEKEFNVQGSPLWIGIKKG